MKFNLILLGAFCAALFLPGCAAVNSSQAPALAATATTKPAESPQNAASPRMLVWKAHLTLEVENPAEASTQASTMAEKMGGWVERGDADAEKSATLDLRVPTKNLKEAMAAVEALGEVKSKGVESVDVTEQCVDLDARLKSKTALRDRLRQLLEKAADVKDILAVETELARVQADIDSMDARLKSLTGKVDYALLHIHFERRRIPGPVSYLFQGLWWGIEKLFVIRI